MGQTCFTRLRIVSAALCVISVPAFGQETGNKTKNELEGVKQQLEQAAKRENQISRDLSALEKEAQEISGRLIALAAKTQSGEIKISAGETQIADLNHTEKELLLKLSSRRDTLGELLIGLQRLEKDPPPPLVAHPDDALAAVRSATLFASIIPAIKSETTAIRADLSRLKKVRARLDATQENVKTEQKSLDGVREELNALLERKRGFLLKTRKDLETEKARTAVLALKAKNLNQLLARLKADRAAAEKRRLEAEKRKTAAEQKALARKRARLLQPKIAFSKTAGNLPLPVAGRLLRRYHQKDRLGSKSQGIFLATRKRAQIIAPASGVVEYAGKFRTYGQLLILNVGEGYRMLLGGLGRIDVTTGQNVLAGEPVGLMGEKADRGTLITSALDVDNPVLYIEFRKNGGTIDSASWWRSDRKKVQN